MAAQTLLQLRTRALQRADMVNSQFVTTAEVTGLVNVALARLHDLLVTAYEDYYVTVATPFGLTVNKEAYDLVADCGIVDFEKIICVFLTTGSGATLSRFKLRKFRTNELGRLNNPQLIVLNLAPALLWYRCMGNKLYLEPMASGGVSGWNCEVWYVPQAPTLVADSDTTDAGIVNGWDEFIVNEVAINLRLKEESDISGLMARQQVFEQKLEAVAQARDTSDPERVVDTEAAYYVP